MTTACEYMSFLVRLSHIAGYGNGESPAPSQGWHCEIEHIQTGQCWTFNAMQDLLEFLRRLAEDSRIPDMPEMGHTE